MQIRFMSDSAPLIAKIGEPPIITDAKDYSVLVEIEGMYDAPMSIFGMTPDDATANAIAFVEGLADEGTEIETIADHRRNPEQSG